MASRDMTKRLKAQRSQRHETNPVKSCINLVVGARIKFILGS